MKTRITLTVDDELLRVAEALAARRGFSLEHLLVEQLEALVRRDEGYETAMHRALARLDRRYDLQWVPPADRGGVHQR